MQEIFPHIQGSKIKFRPYPQLFDENKTKIGEEKVEKFAIRPFLSPISVVAIIWIICIGIEIYGFKRRLILI